MRIVFYVSRSGNCLVADFVKKLTHKDRAKVLACLKSIEELGYKTPRVSFRQVNGKLWEIKIISVNSSVRIFYIALTRANLVLLHGYKKTTQKAPSRHITIAMKRLVEVLKNDHDYIK